MNIVYVLTGGNLGNRLANLENAKEYLKKETGNILRSSAIYETQAWGNTEQPDFYNQVHIINTKLSPEQIMQKILKIEEQMGRVRTIKNASRVIDIDILFFNNDVINKKDLIIPHEEISNRRFVLIPLNELSSGLVHPVFHKSISELLSTCKDTLSVKLLKTLSPFQPTL
ncbi:MAG: 2-amino-4-hydroxy-6-hydroxymethyldihydropteridine diphosphokinase [Ginsengibacter sp.]